VTQKKIGLDKPVQDIDNKSVLMHNTGIKLPYQYLFTGISFPPHLFAVELACGEGFYNVYLPGHKYIWDPGRERGSGGWRHI
jgi:hypothetical protein